MSEQQILCQIHPTHSAKVPIFLTCTAGRWSAPRVQLRLGSRTGCTAPATAAPTPLVPPLHVRTTDPLSDPPHSQCKGPDFPHLYRWEGVGAEGPAPTRLTNGLHGAGHSLTDTSCAAAACQNNRSIVRSTALTVQRYRFSSPVPLGGGRRRGSSSD